MKQELIDELQALLDAGTQGEWDGKAGYLTMEGKVILLGWDKCDEDLENSENNCLLIAKFHNSAPALLEAARENLRLRRALSKVPLFRMTEDALGWECCGCGAVAGITEDGRDRDEPCKPGCYVAIVEDALALGKETV
jgi:hypothetical protein